MKWFTHRITFGVDRTREENSELYARVDSLVSNPTFESDALGYIALNNRAIDNTTVDYAATASFDLSPTLRSSTSGGIQFYHTTYTKMNDPRVPFADKGRNSVTGYHLYRQDKYTASSSPIRLASRDEARLIIAEANVAVRDFVGADSIITNFRARGGQGAFTSVDSATVADSLFDQRKREFFLEGQHLFDLVRFSKTPNPPDGTAFNPGGTYGSQLCLRRALCIVSTHVMMLYACCHSSRTANARTGKLPIPFTGGGTA